MSTHEDVITYDISDSTRLGLTFGMEPRECLRGDPPSDRLRRYELYETSDGELFERVTVATETVHTFKPLSRNDAEEWILNSSGGRDTLAGIIARHREARGRRLLQRVWQWVAWEAVNFSYPEKWWPPTRGASEARELMKRLLAKGPPTTDAQDVLFNIVGTIEERIERLGGWLEEEDEDEISF
jgi:hypothetical protein